MVEGSLNANAFTPLNASVCAPGSLIDDSSSRDAGHVSVPRHAIESVVVGFEVAVEEVDRCRHNGVVTRPAEVQGESRGMCDTEKREEMLRLGCGIEVRSAGRVRDGFVGVAMHHQHRYGSAGRGERRSHARHRHHAANRLVWTAGIERDGQRCRRSQRLADYSDAIEVRDRTDGGIDHVRELGECEAHIFRMVRDVGSACGATLLQPETSQRARVRAPQRRSQLAPRARRHAR